jgi:AcrR family transcriptional regulator
VTVGVDAILAKADVARRSLYQHFGGKDRLIAEVLRSAAERDIERYASFFDAAGDDPRRRLLAVFDAVEAVVSSEGYRGCRYLAADLALPDRDHPAHIETRAHWARLHRLLERELDKLEHPGAAEAADRLMILIQGALATAATRPGTRPTRIVRAMAEAVIDG